MDKTKQQETARQKEIAVEIGYMSITKSSKITSAELHSMIWKAFKLGLEYSDEMSK